MAKDKSYSEKLKDPRWQKKRLEILSRDKWHCMWCGDNLEMLIVHHLWYERGKEPWECPDEALITVCETCHRTEFEERSTIEQELLELLRRTGWSASDVADLDFVIRCSKIPKPWDITSAIQDAIIDHAVFPPAKTAETSPNVEAR